MDALNPSTAPVVLFKFHTPADIAQYVAGSDNDIGGNSTAKLELGHDGKGRFYGEMRTDVKPHMEGKIRSGYAGFRNKVRTNHYLAYL